MLGIEFAMLKIDLPGSNIPEFFSALVMYVLILGIDISSIPLTEGTSWVAILLILIMLC